MTTAQDRTGEARSAGAASTSSKIDPNRGLPPPPLAWLASAVTNARGMTVPSTWVRESTASVRTTSSRWGSSTTATSEPPAKSTRPVHHPKSSPTRYAPNGPRSSGPGIERSDSPPPPEVRPICRARSTAAATIRVAAMGDTALTRTPGGVWRPSCHVSEAMARLAQL